MPSHDARCGGSERRYGRASRLRDGAIRRAARRLAALRPSFALLALALLLHLDTAIAAASEPSAPPAAEDGWQIEFVPYLWVTEVHGSIGIGDLTAPIDVGFDQVFDLMGAGDLLGGMGHLELRRRRLAFFVDAVGSVVRTDESLTAGKAQLAADFAAVELGAAYRFYEAAGGTIGVDAVVGGRYNFVFNSIDLEVGPQQGGPQRSSSIDFVDPFVGGRWSVGLADGLSLVFRGDIGGFGAGSQLAWSLLGGFRYQTPWEIGAARLFGLAGYKVYDFDYESGSGSGRRAIAEEFRGPALGLGASF